jgi:predicted dehydrogenase
MLNRRDFLKASIAASAPMFISARAFGLDGPGANDTVRVGLIGLGGRCKDIAQTSVGIPGMQIAAICDCFKPRLDGWMQTVGEQAGWKPYLDFREMIEKEKLDGVMVETTTHARAWIACSAMAMGCDTYIEKPMCLSIDEGREMVEIARKYGTVTQVGTQQRSMPLNNWASDLVKNGALGKVVKVLAPDFVGPQTWQPQEAQPMPEGATPGWWDIWTNQSELRPYHHDLHYGWARWDDYDGGGVSFGVSGWGTHSYDQLQRGLGTDETGPVEIMLEEEVADRPSGKFEAREPAATETGAGYYGMANLVGPRAKVRMKYANGTIAELHLDADFGPGLGAIFVGENGRIEINRDMISSDRPELISGSDRPPALSVPETQPHIENWINCIKTRERCTADIEYGHRSSSLCYLVNIVRNLGRVGETLHWDPVKERFTDCNEGNRMLARKKRYDYRLKRI